MQWLRKLEGARLAIAGLVVAAVLFVAVNVLAGATLRNAQVDLTDGSLYTLSDSTRRVLGKLDEPVQLRLYFSSRLNEVAPRVGAYYARIRDLLLQYATLSNGKLRVDLLEPEPFSDAEDRAVADGLQGVPLSASGEVGYFGLVGTNSTDGRAVVPFFNLEREQFIEYDLTKLIYGLGNPERPALGLMSALPDPGGPGMPHGGQAPITLFEQLGEFFTVENLPPDAEAIPDNVRTLLVAGLREVSAPALKAIDRFVHGGGTALVFVDPMIETAPADQPEAAAASQADVDKLLAAWGVKLESGKIASDLDAARRVSAGARGVVSDYVAWLTLSRPNFDAGDPVLANIERLNLATAGVLQPLEGASTTFTPLVETGPRAMAMDQAKFRYPPDVLAIRREFEPGNKPLVLVARLTGDAPLAFAELATAAQPSPATAATPGSEPAAGEAAKPEAPSADAAARKPINVILVSDADMLYDRFWLQSSDFFGERVNVPTAGNGDFVMNALENLGDAQALSGLRGRGTAYRPFTLVEQLRRDAESLYRAKEQELQTRLKELEQQLESVQQRGQGGQGGEIVLSADDRAAIERFRGEILGVRRDLREVQRALRSDIEQVESWVKFANIGAVPIVLCGIGIVVAVVNRLRRGRAKRRPDAR